MKPSSRRISRKLSIEWKTDDASSQEVRIRHCGAGEVLGDGKIAGRQYDYTQPLTLPSPLPNRRGYPASRKRGVWDDFIRNGLGFAILLVGLCAPTFSWAAFVAAWGDNNFGQTYLPPRLGEVRAVAAGFNHSLALTTDGRVVAWGASGLTPQTTVPPGLSNVVAIAAGADHNLALKSDGTVAAWGKNTYGQTSIPVGLSNVIAISSRLFHNLALKVDGTVIAWGNGESGQTSVPVGLSKVKAIAAGSYHSLALKTDGTLIGWGRINTDPLLNIPAGLSNVIAIAAGYDHNLALTVDGRVVAWGYNNYGEINVPTALSDVTDMAAGLAQSIVLKADGNVVVWGYNGPAWGYSSFGHYSLPEGMSNVTAIAAGGFHHLAVVFAGPIQILQNPLSQEIPYTSNATFSVVATGREPLNYHWLLNGSSITPNPRVSGTTSATLTITNLQPTDMGTYSVIVSNAFGSVVSSNASLTVISPPFIMSQSPDQTIGAGTFVTLSVSASGTPPLSFQWTLNGTNLPGRTFSNLFFSDAQPEHSGLYSVIVSNLYGLASTDMRLTVTNTAPYFTQPPFLTTTNLRTTIASPVPIGSSVALNVTAKGSLPLSYQWRFNGVDIPAATTAVLRLNQVSYEQTGYYSVEVSNAFGSTNSMKLLLNVSQVVLAGTPFTGNTNLPLALSNVIAVAAGGSHVMALRSDGTVRTWLANANYIFDQAYGVTNVPSSVTNVIAIAAGRSHCLALRSNGTVVAWGPSTSGQTSVPAGLSNVVAIAAGWYRSYAVKADGTITGWGSSATIPTGLSNVVAVAAGPSQILALRRDGTVAMWSAGSATFFVASGLSNAIAIATGSTANRALRQDGTVVTWPLLSTAQPVLVNEGRVAVSNVVAIALGSTGASMLLKQDGTLSTSELGQIAPPATNNISAIAAGGVQSGFGVMVVGNGSPTITLHPYSQTVQKSNTVQLHARAAGLQPMRYQWLLDNLPLPDRTNASLMLSNVLGEHTGAYRMIASNALGIAASQIASLTIPFNTNLTTALNPQLQKGWTTGLTNRAWFAQNRVTHDGDVAAQSGLITHNQESPLQTSFSGPGTVTFWWRVSSEEGFDYLRLFVGQSAIPVASISGETSWQQQTVRIASQLQTLKWVYAKDGSVSGGGDAGWLDEVVFTPDPPVIALQPTPPNTTAAMGNNFTLQVTATGVGPLSYQWLKNNDTLIGATQANLTLTNLTRRHSGTYSVRVANAGGSISSSNATLVVRVPQRLKAPVRFADGSWLVTSGDADGGALLPDDLAALEVQASTNLVNWVTMPGALALTNGLLVLCDPARTNCPARFYRAVER